jgi:hypothetical protein
MPINEVVKMSITECETTCGVCKTGTVVYQYDSRRQVVLVLMSSCSCEAPPWELAGLKLLENAPQEFINRHWELYLRERLAKYLPENLQKENKDRIESLFENGHRYRPSTVSDPPPKPAPGPELVKMPRIGWFSRRTVDLMTYLGGEAREVRIIRIIKGILPAGEDTYVRIEEQIEGSTEARIVPLAYIALIRHKTHGTITVWERGNSKE